MALIAAMESGASTADASRGAAPLDLCPFLVNGTGGRTLYQIRAMAANARFAKFVINYELDEFLDPAIRRHPTTVANLVPEALIAA